ncbi:uncharacterized protein CCOS01_16780 [Colletotrichum costaricense]|uniref:Uncharacterized protein n=1 Tax=Colletotrichum costaricense TaxID=1209916 RepID=A0AAJ0DS93_9PEZI|nr:uncharacterized protein CCOS01_16780 [Colletotrichum costaricense]KAK1505206.1 hypothetical protein CCOS01_16780 [Colletotrichum costaricense]KAK1708993.1 hypothetical protein BDP67DRAFT_523986 [Colletotrichum lupini]
MWPAASYVCVCVCVISASCKHMLKLRKFCPPYPSSYLPVLLRTLSVCMCTEHPALEWNALTPSKLPFSFIPALRIRIP